VIRRSAATGESIKEMPTPHGVANEESEEGEVP